MELNYAAIRVATVVQFMSGAVWYSALFAKVWGRIHGADVLSPAELKAAQKTLMPLLGVQLALTIVTSVVFAVLLAGIPADWNPYGFAVITWFGCVMPAQVSAVLFGGTAPLWIMKKIAVSIGASLCCYLAAAQYLLWCGKSDPHNVIL